MRLDEGVIRELHWHNEAEWAFMIAGKARVTGLDTEGGSFIDDVEAGDLWYWPAGHPHSIQGLSPNGTEFLLIFDDGNFSEDSTFLLTDWMSMFFLVALKAESCLTDANNRTHTEISAEREFSHTTENVQLIAPI